MEAWYLGKGSCGKGGNGTYGLEDDWIEGYGGYSFGYADTAFFSLAREATDEWQVPKSRKTVSQCSCRATDRAFLPIEKSSIVTVRRKDAPAFL